MSITQKLICSVLLLISGSAHCQVTDLSFGANYGGFNMSEVRQLQNEIKSQISLPVKEISSFPSFVGYEGKVTVHFSRLRIGVIGGVNSTGSRLSYADYSGSLEYNQLAKITHIGFITEFKLKRDSSSTVQPYFSIQLEKGWTRFDIQEKIVVNGSSLVNENPVFRSRHTTIQPGFGIRKSLSYVLFISMYASYLIDSATFLEDLRDKDIKLLDQNFQPVSVNWSGFRIGITLGFNFN